MINKINMEIVDSVLAAQGLSNEQITNAINEMIRLQQEAKQQEDGEKGPKVKQKHIIVMTGLPEDFNPAIASAWIVKIPEEQESSEVLDNLVMAANAYNDSIADTKPKLKVRNLAETIEFVPSKFFKTTTQSSRVTKEPVDVIKGEPFASMFGTTTATQTEDMQEHPEEVEEEGQNHDETN